MGMDAMHMDYSMNMMMLQEQPAPAAPIGGCCAAENDALAASKATAGPSNGGGGAKVASEHKAAKSFGAHANGGSADAAAKGAASAAGAGHTTVMLRNLPAGFTQQMLFDLISSAGFFSQCSFVYLPIDFVKQVSLGYALVDLPKPANAQAFFEYFDGYADWSAQNGSAAPCSASWSDPHQGLEQLVERYRSSPVMHGLVPEEWKPVILENGSPTAFPAPRKAIKAPKIRGGYETLR
jgi:hypothetical protein